MESDNRGRMKPPKELTGEALSFWKRNQPLLQSMGIWHESDKDSFVLLCKVWAKLIEAEAAGLDAIKFVALSKQAQNLMKAFGLTPEARKRLKIETTQDEIDEYGL